MNPVHIRSLGSLVVAFLAFAVTPTAGFADTRTERAAIQAVEAFARSIATADVALLNSVWSKDIDISAMENGVPKYGRDETLSGLTSELRLAKDVVFEASDLNARADGRIAWVTFEYRLKARIQERSLDTSGGGTALLRREAGAMRLVHLNMANRPRPTPRASATTMNRVLVIGATGRSGPALLNALKFAGYTNIRAFVRDPAAARQKLGADIELAQGDVRDAQSLAAALQGVTYVVSALGSNSFTDPANSPEFVDYEGVRNIANAAKAAGVSHYVQISSLGVTNPNHPLNRFGRVMDWKLKGENAIRASGVAYTIVRAGGLLDEPGEKSGIRALQGDKLDTGRISRNDVAAVCVKALGNSDAVNKTLEIVAGESGDAVDWSSFFKVLTPDAKN